MALAVDQIERSPSWWQMALTRWSARARTSWTPHKLYLGGTAEAATLSAFRLWCEANEGAVCEVALSSRALLSSVLPSALSMKEASEQAVAQWAHYNDIEPEAFAQQWVLRPLAQSSFGLLCAAPRSLIEGLRAAGGEHGVQLRWVGPWWVRGVQAWLASLPASVQHERSPQLTLIEPDACTHVHATQVAGAPAALSLIWTEAAAPLSPSSAGPDQHVVCVTAPEEPRAHIDTPGGYLWCHERLSSLLAGDASTWQAPS